MKNFKSLLAVAATVAISGAAHAAPSITVGAPSYNPTAGAGNPGNRNFAFEANAASTLGGSGSIANATASFTGGAIDTQVTVKPYLYAIGQLGGDWEMDGWGDGTFATTANTQHLDVWHSNPFKITSSGWGNPARANDPTRTIPMTFKVTSKNAAGSSIAALATPAGPQIAVSNFNAANNMVISPDGAGGTLGHLDSEFDFTLTPNASTYSGTYSMTPTLTFTSQ